MFRPMQRRRALKCAIAFASLVGAMAALVGASFLLSPIWPATAVGARPGDASPIVQGNGLARPLAVTRIAHASVLLDFDGVRVLTDPWFTEKWHYHQGEPLGLRLEDLPRLDLIVASHAHYDHFDIKSLAGYPHKDVPFLVGPDMIEAVRAVGFTDVRELKPWQTWSRGELKVTGAPARVIQRIRPVTAIMASVRSSRKFSRAAGMERPRRRMIPTVALRKVESGLAPARTRQRSSFMLTSRT